MLAARGAQGRFQEGWAEPEQRQQQGLCKARLNVVPRAAGSDLLRWTLGLEALRLRRVA